MALSSITSWRERGKTMRTPDGDVFVLSHNEDANARVPVLALHGFPTSSHDFDGVFSLAKNRHFVTFDMIGFGLSDKPSEFGYSLFEQADLAELTLKRFDVKRAHIWAHDMGTSVATELCARRERGLLSFEMVSLTLMNGSVHQELASLTLGQRILRTPAGALFARLNSERSFTLQMQRIFGKRVDDDDVRSMWELLARENGSMRLPQAIVYAKDRIRFKKRWIGALTRLDIPALIAWGKKDPVALMTIADALASEIPNAERTTWDALGHYPQVEDPVAVSKTLESFWSKIELTLLRK